MFCERCRMYCQALPLKIESSKSKLILASIEWPLFAIASLRICRPLPPHPHNQAELIMTNPNHPSSATENDWYESAHSQLKKKPGGASEADIEQVLIRPVLENVLGYRIAEIDSNMTVALNRGMQTAGNLRPDFTCRRNGEISLIPEAKKFWGGFANQNRTRVGDRPFGTTPKVFKTHAGHQEHNVGNSHQW